MRPSSIALGLCLLVGCAHTAPQRVADRPPVHVDLTVQGKALAAAGDNVRAEQYLAGALEAGGDVDVVLPSLLRVCIASERYEAALAYAERYEPTARDSTELRLVLASLQMAVGQVENARRNLELVLSQNNDPQAHYMLGELYYHLLQDYASADSHYRQYLTLSPNGRHASNVRRLLMKTPADAAALPVEAESAKQAEATGEEPSARPVQQNFPGMENEPVEAAQSHEVTP